MDITQAGSIYVDLTAENTADVDVYFDDLKITHYRKKVITQTTDYYPFGSVLRRAETNEDNTYRYGYQGQYAEEDQETNWSFFELRMYDPIIGRFMRVDPYQQYYSPYEAMGNNPIKMVDPNGGQAGDGTQNPICQECLIGEVTITSTYTGTDKYWKPQNYDYNSILNGWSQMFNQFRADGPKEVYQFIGKYGTGTGLGDQAKSNEKVVVLEDFKPSSLGSAPGNPYKAGKLFAKGMLAAAEFYETIFGDGSAKLQPNKSVWRDGSRYLIRYHNAPDTLFQIRSKSLFGTDSLKTPEVNGNFDPANAIPFN